MSYINTKGPNELGAIFNALTPEGNEVDYSDLGSVMMLAGRDGGNLRFSRMAFKQLNNCAFQAGDGGCGTTLNGLDLAHTQEDFYVAGGAYYSKVREAPLSANSAAWLSNVEVLKTTQLGSTVQARNNAKLDHLQSAVLNAGEFVRWTGTTFEGAVVSGGGGGASYFNDLTDVDLTNAADGDIIGFDIATGKWKNGQLQLGSMTLAADPSPTLSADLSGANHNIDLQGGKALFSNVYTTLQDLPTSATYHGMFAHVIATGAAYYSHVDNVSGVLTWHRLHTDGSAAPTNYTDPLSTVAYSGSYTDLLNIPQFTLEALSGVNISGGVSANEVLTWSPANGGEWVNAAPQGGGFNGGLNDLNDVTAPSPTGGQIVQYVVDSGDAIPASLIYDNGAGAGLRATAFGAGSPGNGVNVYIMPDGATAGVEDQNANVVFTISVDGAQTIYVDAQSVSQAMQADGNFSYSLTLPGISGNAITKNGGHAAVVISKSSSEWATVAATTSSLSPPDPNTGSGSVTAINLRRYTGDGAGGYHWVYGTWINFLSDDLWFAGNDALYLGQTAGGQEAVSPSSGWQAVTPSFGGGSLTLDELTNVVVPSPNHGEFLQYTSQNNWQNVALFLDNLKSNSADGNYVVDVTGSDVSLIQPPMPMLDDLTNVNTTDAADGRFVRRDEQVGVVPSVTISEDPAGNGVAGTLVVEARENLSFFMGVVFTSQLVPVWDNGSGLTLMPPDFGIYLVRGNDVDGLPGDSLFFMADTATGTDANGGPIWNNPGSYPSSGATILELVHDNQGNPVLDGNGAPTFVDVTNDRWKVTGTGWFTSIMLYAADSGQLVSVNLIGVTGNTGQGNTQSTITDVGVAGQHAVAEYKVQPLTSLDIVGAATGEIAPQDNEHLVWDASASKFLWAADVSAVVDADDIKQALTGNTADPSAAGYAFVWDGDSWEYGLVPSAYTLPVATTNTLGGIMGGSNVSIDNGVLSFTPPAITVDDIIYSMTGAVAGSSNEGQTLVWHESTSNLIWAALGGSYTLPLADGSTRGGIKYASTVTVNGAAVPTYISLTNEVIGVDVATLYGALSTSLWADPTVYGGDIQFGNVYLGEGQIRLKPGGTGYESGEVGYQEPGTIRAAATTGDIEAYIADGAGQNAAWISLSADTQGPTYTAGAGINIDGSDEITSTVEALPTLTNNDNGKGLTWDQNENGGAGGWVATTLATDYTLVTATWNVKGGVIVGGGLSILGDGTLSANGYGGTGYISVSGNTFSLDVTPEGLTNLALVGHTHISSEITDLSDADTTYTAGSASGGDYISIAAPSGGSSVGTVSLVVNPANETPALSVTGHTHTVSELTDYTAVTDTNTTYTSGNSDITIVAPSGESTVGTITFNAGSFASSDHGHTTAEVLPDATNGSDDGKVLTYQGDATGFTWEAPTSGGATNLGDLGDVTGGGEDGQVLTLTGGGAAGFVDVPVTADNRGIKTYTQGDVSGAALEAKSLLITSSVFKGHKIGVMRYEGVGESIEKVYLPLTMDPAGSHDDTNGIYAEAGKFLAYETFTIINQSAGERITVIEIYGWESNSWTDPFNPNVSGGEFGITVGGGSSSPGGGSSGRMIVQLSPGGSVTLAAYVNETTQKTDWLVVGQSGDAPMLAV